MNPATSPLLQILIQTLALIAMAHNRQAVNVKVAGMGMGTTMDEDEEAEKEKRRERRVQMPTRRCQSQNPRMDRRGPSHRVIRTAS
jgi:hypothetical protein